MNKNFDLKEFGMYLNLAQTKAKQTGKTVEFTIAENVFCRVSAVTGNASFFARKPKKVIGYASVMTAEQAIKIANECIEKNKSVHLNPRKKNRKFSVEKLFRKEIISGLIFSFNICIFIAVIAVAIKFTGIV